MIKGGIGGANTLTGADFAKQVDLRTYIASKPDYEVRAIPGKAGMGVFYRQDLKARTFQEHEFYTFLREKGINWKTKVSKKVLPDDALLVIVCDKLFIIEVKFQKVGGSVDEKLQTCDFKRKHYAKLVSDIGLFVEYVYVLADYFNAPRYKDVLDYVRSMGCHVKFGTPPLSWLGLPES